jgi:hypothetical protein
MHGTQSYYICLSVMTLYVLRCYKAISRQIESYQSATGDQRALIDPLY